jgi:biopolymer transport protein ExbD
MHAASAPIRAEPNVTPMIDVMLVLLIIFMAVGPLIDLGFRAQPPAGVHLTAHPDDASDVVVGLDSVGRYYFNKRLVSEAQLKDLLAHRFRTGVNNRVAYIRADRSLEYARVVVAMDLAARSGARVVGLVSEPIPSFVHSAVPMR